MIFMEKIKNRIMILDCSQDIIKFTLMSKFYDIFLLIMIRKYNNGI